MANIFWALKDTGSPSRGKGSVGALPGTWMDRKDAIEFAEWNYHRPWNKLYKWGFRAIRVKVFESATGNFWALTQRGPYGLKGGFFVGTYLTRKEVIKDAVKNFGNIYPNWEAMYRNHFRAVRVKVTEIPAKAAKGLRWYSPIKGRT